MDDSTQIIKIPKINLNWSEWVPWLKIIDDARSGGIQIPNHTKGVYEVKYQDKETRLQIGKASDLRRRIRQGLVKGMNKHSSGEKIRQNEDLARIVTMGNYRISSRSRRRIAQTLQDRV